MQNLDQILIASIALLLVGLAINRIQRHFIVNPRAVIWSLLGSVMAGFCLATASIAILIGYNLAITVAILFLSALAFPLAGTVEKLLDLFGYAEFAARISQFKESLLR